MGLGSGGKRECLVGNRKMGVMCRSGTPLRVNG